MAPSAAQNPRQNPARTTALTAIAGAGGGGRAFVDATGTPVPLLRPVRRLVATDDDVAALLLGLGASVVGCAGTVDGVESVGGSRSPDRQAVAALRPDAIVTGVVAGRHDLADVRLVAALRQVAPVIAVDVGRPAEAAADLRALIGTVGARRPVESGLDTPPAPPRRPSPPRS